MQRHTESVHHLSTPFICPICPRLEFYRKDKANDHCKAIHDSSIDSDWMKEKALLLEQSSTTFPDGEVVIPSDTLTDSVSKNASNDNKRCLPVQETEEPVALDFEQNPSSSGEATVQEGIYKKVKVK
jgi:hypothetical protein